ARHSRRRRFVLLGLALWTLLVGFALSRLLADSGSTVWIVHDEGAPNALQKAGAAFRTDAGLQRLYPWLLFCPYAALLAFYFPLERGRLRLTLPLNLAACGVFATACHLINARTSQKATHILFFANQSISGVATGTNRTNIVQFEMVQSGPGGSLS